MNNIPVEIIALDKIEVEGRSGGGKKEIDSLAEDLKANGIIYPVILAVGAAPGLAQERNKNTVYRLKAGRKRYEAARVLEWDDISAVVIPANECWNEGSASKTVALEDKFAKLIEACQHKEMSDYDLAKTAIDLEERFTLKGTDFGRVMGLSQSYTYNLMRWYRESHPEVREAWKEDHNLLNQAELEHMSHMPDKEALAYWHKRIKLNINPEPYMPGRRGHKLMPVNGTNNGKLMPVKIRRPTEVQMLKLYDAIEAAPLIAPVKDMMLSLVRFALGTVKNVPGITDYKKLSAIIVDKEAVKEASKESAVV